MVKARSADTRPWIQTESWPSLAWGADFADPRGMVTPSEDGPTRGGDGAGGGVPGPADWAERYRLGETPWDLGGAHPELSLRLSGGSLAPPRTGARVLVPGAGRGHDAVALARRGWTVVALDVVGSLGEDLGTALARLGGRFVEGDALDFEDEPFDLIWDHTFFCAISPADREPWGRRAGELLLPGGLYAALVFPFGKPASEEGPPHGMSSDDLLRVLGARTEVIEDVEVQRRAPARRWAERFLLARRHGLDLASPA